MNRWQIDSMSGIGLYRLAYHLLDASPSLQRVFVIVSASLDILYSFLENSQPVFCRKIISSLLLAGFDIFVAICDLDILGFFWLHGLHFTFLAHV